MLHYTYTATGQKISQQLEDDGRLGTRREYAGPFVYVNNTLGWINTIYGRIVAVPKGGLRKELHLRDHLGNTRMVLEERDRNYEVVQEAAYYPFGMAIPSQSFALPNENNTYQNRYLYNGKEYQDDFGLNLYDYGARFYDAQIGRWHSVDPWAEKYYSMSPYNYVGNNPVIFIDPDGRGIIDAIVKAGTRYLLNAAENLAVAAAKEVGKAAEDIAENTNIELKTELKGTEKIGFSAGVTGVGEIEAATTLAEETLTLGFSYSADGLEVLSENTTSTDNSTEVKIQKGGLGLGGKHTLKTDGTTETEATFIAPVKPGVQQEYKVQTGSDGGYSGSAHIVSGAEFPVGFNMFNGTIRHFSISISLGINYKKESK